MQRYIGTKIVKGEPMTRGEYNVYRGWTLPGDEDGTDPGYLVEYEDGGKSNHPVHDGYISWSPADVFERAYRQVDGLTFGAALEAVKAGQRVARAGWNGKGQFVCLVTPAHLQQMIKGGYGAFADGYEATGALAIFTTSGHVQVGWLATQSDMLSSDWLIL